MYSLLWIAYIDTHIRLDTNTPQLSIKLANERKHTSPYSVFAGRVHDGFHSIRFGSGKYMMFGFCTRGEWNIPGVISPDLCEEGDTNSKLI